MIELYIESGEKRVFACAVEWPGWSRGGRDEASALQALLDYAPRYARAMRVSAVAFQPPADASAFRIVERLPGDTTTDFGAPGAIPAADWRTIEGGELQRLQELLKACWQAFDDTVAAARGIELSKGPRGGGRELEAIVAHVLGAESSYLGALGWKLARGEAAHPTELTEQLRAQLLAGMAASARGEIPERGPRGGQRWPPRYFARREAWHMLDHAWEIEDRAAGQGR